MGLFLLFLSNNGTQVKILLKKHTKLNIKLTYSDHFRLHIQYVFHSPFIAADIHIIYLVGKTIVFPGSVRYTNVDNVNL